MGGEFGAEKLGPHQSLSLSHGQALYWTLLLLAWQLHLQLPGLLLCCGEWVQKFCQMQVCNHIYRVGLHVVLLDCMDDAQPSGPFASLHAWSKHSGGMIWSGLAMTVSCLCRLTRSNKRLLLSKKHLLLSKKHPHASKTHSFLANLRHSIRLQHDLGMLLYSTMYLILFKVE